MVNVEYGKSMYGGWYANYFANGIYAGTNAETLKDLKEKLNNNLGLGKWEFSRRYDNDN